MNTMATEIDENIREALRLQESVLFGLLGDAVYGKFVAVKATWAANARQQHGASISNSSFIHWLLAFTDNDVAAEISHNHGQEDRQQCQQDGEVLQMEQNCIKTEPCMDENNIVISNITHINSGDEISIQTNVGLQSATDPSHVTLNDLLRFGVNGNVNELEESTVEEGSDIDSMQDGDVESTMISADTEADIAVEPVLNTMLDTPPVVVTPPPTSASVKLETGEPWPQVSSNGPVVSHTEPVESPPAPELNLKKGRPLFPPPRKRYSCRYCSYTTTKSAASLHGHEVFRHRQFIAKTKTLQKNNTQHMSVGHNEEVEGQAVGHNEEVEGQPAEHNEEVECQTVGHNEEVEGQLVGHNEQVEGQLVGHNEQVEGQPAEHNEANSTFSPSPPTQLSTTSPSLLSAPALPTPTPHRHDGRTFYRCTVCDYCYPRELQVLSHIASTHLDAEVKGSQRNSRKYNVHELAGQPDVTIVDVSMIDLHDGVHKGISRYYRAGDKRRKKSNRAVMTEAIEVMRKMTEAIAASNNAAFENSET